MEHSITQELLEEIKRTIRQELSSKPQPKYLRTADASEVLGYPDRRQLLRAVESGILRVGIEVQDRRSANSEKPNYYFHIERCEKRLFCPPEKRQ